ncbi:FAFR174Wp [Eremothecium gossypii FDAG1]|nr:FAFR174Wp [Eremothecium gossypii FDAG1]
MSSLYEKASDFDTATLQTRMVQPFTRYAAHRHLVLSWYRYTLRITNYVPISNLLRRQTREVVRETILKHRGTQSSWKVLQLLEDMKQLNSHLAVAKAVGAWQIIQKYAAKPTPQEERLPMPAKHYNDPSKDKEAHYYWRYHRDLTRKHLLPAVIPNDYMEKLIAPLARHASDLRTLDIVQRNIQRSPKAYLSYTMVGSDRLWFVRSAVNRKKRQSRRLTAMIVALRRAAQRSLDMSNRLKEEVIWATHEAKWEQLLATGTLPPDGAKSDWKPGRAWLEPYEAAFRNQLANRKRTSQKLKRYSAQISKVHLPYYIKCSAAMHTRRAKRFECFQKELHTVNPFVPGRDLGSLLSKWRMVNGKNYYR